MKNKISALFIISALVFSFCGCALTEVTPIASGEITAPAETLQPTVSIAPNVPDDIIAQDKCIISYFDALKQNDADKIIRLSTSSMTGKLYSNFYNSDFYGELYSMAQTSNLMEYTSLFIYSILSDYDRSKPVINYSDELIEEFIMKVNPARLADIKVLALGTPHEQPQLNVPDSLQVDLSVFSHRLCLFSIGENMYYQLFTLVKSDNSYMLASIGDYDKLKKGISENLSREDFDALVDIQTINEPSEEILAPSAEIFGETTYLQKIKETPAISIKNSGEVIGYFAESLAHQDAYAALSAFAIKENANKFNLHNMSEAMGAFVPYNFGGITSEYAFYRDINLAVFCSQRASEILLLLPAFSYDYSILFNSEFSPDIVFSAMQKTSDNISSLSLIRSDVFKDTANYNSYRYANAYGADETEYRIVEYMLGEEAYVSGMELINYSGEWRIQGYSTVLLGLPVTFPVLPSSKLDYDSFI
jgi:hypothetical protein